MKMFTKDYWLSSAKELKNTRSLALAALICALTVVLDGAATIKFIPNVLEIKFTFFVIALGCAVYGPVTGMVIAAVVDTLCFFLANNGYAYFPGYMLTEVLVALTYGLFFYRQKITVAKLFGAKLCTNFLWHVGLNTLWSTILYDKGYLYYLGASLIKNAAALLPEVLIMAVVFAVMIPPLSKVGLLPAHSQKELRRLTLFSKKENQ
ncbi:MAG: folate family ECF transporter S component [Clostridia bacterium]|nr:folate family ECF transporter S component [Clostridia bacterium]